MVISKLRWWQKAGLGFLGLSVFSVFVHQAQSWPKEAQHDAFMFLGALVFGGVLLLWGQAGKIRRILGWLFVLWAPVQLYMAFNPLTPEQRATMAANEEEKLKHSDSNLMTLCQRAFRSRAHYPQTVEFPSFDKYFVTTWKDDVFFYQAAPTAKNAFGVVGRPLMQCSVKNGLIVNFKIGQEVID
jgi:hypothetical protein